MVLDSGKDRKCFRYLLKPIFLFSEFNDKESWIESLLDALTLARPYTHQVTILMRHVLLSERGYNDGSL